MTGFFRDGCCNTSDNDSAQHTVCVVVTNNFLAFSSECGNDLSTPRPEYNFPGLKAGDRWCVCATRWMEAYQAGVAPKVFLEGTHERMLDYIDLHSLISYSWVKNENSL